jgi:hypothetical protein
MKTVKVNLTADIESFIITDFGKNLKSTNNKTMKTRSWPRYSVWRVIIMV